MELLEHRIQGIAEAPTGAPPLVGEPVHGDDERAARATLREQVARLERELASLFVSAYPREGFSWTVAGRAGPRILSLGELEAMRDELDGRVRDSRADLALRAEAECENRRLIERMMLDPGRFKFVRVRREDIGERGCGQWEVRPRLGLVGMLMNWWHVKLSSGCPLAMGSRL